jgi:hypothetical protein
MIFEEGWLAVGTDAAVNRQDFGTPRGSSLIKLTPNASALERGWRLALARAGSHPGRRRGLSFVKHCGTAGTFFTRSGVKLVVDRAEERAVA